MDCFKIEENKGLIRYLNVLPSQQAVDIYVDNKLLYSDIKYKDFTPYVYMENRPYKIDINEAGTKNILIKTTFRLPDENLFTLAITGNVGQEALIIVDEDVEQKTSNTQAVQRFINLSPDLPIADVFYNDNPEYNKAWSNMGVLAVEMESAALYMNAARLSKNALAMFTISDNLMNGQSLSVEERQEGFDDMIKLSLETARLYNIGGGV